MAHAHLEIATADQQVYLLALHALQVLQGAIDVVQVPMAAALNRNLIQGQQVAMCSIMDLQHAQRHDGACCSTHACLLLPSACHVWPPAAQPFCSWPQPRSGAGGEEHKGAKGLAHAGHEHLALPVRNVGDPRWQSAHPGSAVARERLTSMSKCGECMHEGHP